MWRCSVQFCVVGLAVLHGEGIRDENVNTTPPLGFLASEAILLAGTEDKQADAKMETPETEDVKAVVLNILSVIVNYSDYHVTYTSETTVGNALYDTEEDHTERVNALNAAKHRRRRSRFWVRRRQYPGSLADFIERNSYNKLVVSRALGKVVTVFVNSIWKDVTGCPAHHIIANASAALKSQHPNVDRRDYNIVEYFIPNKDGRIFPRQAPVNGGCPRGGAVLGCNSMWQQRPAHNCVAFYRKSHPGLRAHEVGHLLGLHHSSGPSRYNKKHFQTYGDAESPMGNWQVMSSYIASDRYQLGFLRMGHREVLGWNCAVAHKRVLQSLSLPLNQDFADGVAIKFYCPKCVPKMKIGYNRDQTAPSGGDVWVQFRGKQDYSYIHLDAKYYNKVYVHFARTSAQGTELWATLGAPGEFYETPGEFQSDGSVFIMVCAISNTAAEVGMGHTLAMAQWICNGGQDRPPACQPNAPHQDCRMNNC